MGDLGLNAMSSGETGKNEDPEKLGGKLNFTQAMSGEEVQKAEMGKSKALVTMTDDGKGTSFIL